MSYAATPASKLAKLLETFPPPPKKKRLCPHAKLSAQFAIHCVYMLERKNDSLALFAGRCLVYFVRLWHFAFITVCVPGNRTFNWALTLLFESVPSTKYNRFSLLCVQQSVLGQNYLQREMRAVTHCHEAIFVQVKRGQGNTTTVNNMLISSIGPSHEILT